MISARLKTVLKENLPQSWVRSIMKYRYARAVSNFSDESSAEFRVLSRMVRPGDVVVDLGANYGWYTKMLSTFVGNEGLVYSIEPIPSSFEILDHVIKRDRLENVVPLRCAVSDVEGRSTMAIPRTAGGGEENSFEARIVQGESGDSATYISVRTQRLDSILADVNRPITLIKCDVEGHELQCIRGARSIIRKANPAWLMEVWGNPDEPGSSAARTFSLMKQQGYTPYLMEGEVLRKRTKGRLSGSFNYFFLNRGHLLQLKNEIRGNQKGRRSPA